MNDESKGGRVKSDSEAVYVVTANDGRLFRCHIEEFGGVDRPPRRHWIFVESDGIRFVGPETSAVRHESDLQRSVSDLWERGKTERPTGAPV